MFQRVRKIFLFMVLIVLLSGCSSEPEVKVATEEAATTETKAASSKICVYICGQVKRPGVYTFSSDERIVSAVKAAGGFTEEAAQENINQAEKMKDGQQIYVPSKKEAEESSSAKADSKNGSDSSDKININTAGKEELMTLPGIGESKAGDIIAYREEHGPFSKTEDIMKIQGIKEGIYSKIKDSITI